MTSIDDLVAFLFGRYIDRFEGERIFGAVCYASFDRPRSKDVPLVLHRVSSGIIVFRGKYNRVA